MTAATPRFAFMGTAAFGGPALRAMCAAGYKPVVLYTQPARPAGRGQKPRPTDMARLAEELDIPVETPESLITADARSTFAGYQLDMAIVAAYGLLLPQAILDIPRLGCINIHGSLLPRWRGAAPIQRAIMAGDKETGISLFQMDAGLDTGDVYEMTSCTIQPSWSAGELHDALAALAARMMPDFIARRLAAQTHATPQPVEGASYAHKIRKEEGQINWSNPALTIDRQVRGLTPWPGCFTTMPEGQRLGIVSGQPHERSEKSTALPGQIIEDPLIVACGEGCFAVQEVKPAGRRQMQSRDFLNGATLKKGDVLGG